jgi:hypothetical protein
MIELEGLKDRLRANPIYNLSLGSRELFHSNFLAWLFETYPQMLEALIGKEQETPVEVKREERNLDLIIDHELGGQAFSIVVEVKVKDAPRPEQLMKYNQEIEKMKKQGRVKQQTRRILLTLVPVRHDQVWSKLISSTLEEGGEGWFVLDYGSLGERIAAIANKCKIMADDRPIISRYAQMCSDLSALFQLAVEEDERAPLRTFVTMPVRNKTEKALEELRFLQTLDKYRASRFSDSLFQRSRDLEKTATERGMELKTGYGYDNRTPHAGGAIILPLEPNAANQKRLRLEVHIQGGQYRRLLSLEGFPVPKSKEGKEPGALKSFIDATDNWSWMFGNTNVDGVLKGAGQQGGFFEGQEDVSTRQQRGNLLCSYAPKHIYQHTPISDEEQVNPGNLLDAVIADLGFALQLLTCEDYVNRFRNWRAR